MNGTGKAKRGALLAVLCATAAFVPGASAQEFPSRPVRIVVGFPPGGATDLVARLIAPKLTELLGQQIIVENRSGANGVIGAELVVKAAPDGHTLHLGGLGALVISPAITRVPFDPLKDLAPVAGAVNLQNIFIVHPTLPVRTLKELIALARQKPGALNYATSGTGSPGHLAGELFKSMARVNMTHVPYKGGGPALTDLVAGHIEIFVAVISTAVPQVKAGKARALAVTGSKRAEPLPDVPTVAEAALKGYEAYNWYGVYAPANTPRPVIDRLHRDFVAVLRMSDIRQPLLARGIETAPRSAEDFAKFMKSETDKWTKVVKAAGVKAN